MLRIRIPHRGMVSLLRDVRGSALLEFAIVLPLLMVFVVGIFDFSGAFNQKQKIEQAAQEGAIIAGAQPMSDIDPSNTSANGPDSLQPVVRAIFNSLEGSGVLPNEKTGNCKPPGKSVPLGNLKWQYKISSCPDDLTITINRGLVPAPGPPAAVCTIVSITYPYHWRFNSVIQLLFPGANYLPLTLTESATVHNQM
jgi:TadE-like protein